MSSFKRNQSKAFEDSKVVANNPEVAADQVEFSENYTAEYQYEVQSAHWRQGQIGLFTVVVWSADNGNESIHFCVDRHGAVSTLLLPLVLKYELASGHARLSSISILVRTLRSSLVSKKEKPRLFTRNKETNKLELMWCTPFALASKPSRPTSSNIDTSKLKTKVSVLTGENKTLCHDLHGKDNLLFDSYATVSKLEKQLDNMIRTSSNQEEKLLQMVDDLNQKKRDLKQVMAHYKPSNVAEDFGL